MSPLRKTIVPQEIETNPPVRNRWKYSIRYTMSRLQVIVRTLGIQFLLFVVLMRLAPSVLSLSLLILMASETGEVTLGGYAAGIAALSFAVMMPLYSAVARKFGHTPVLVTTGILNIPMMAILLWQFLQFSNKAFQQGIVGVLVAAALAGATTPPMAAMMRSYWSREYATSKDRKMLRFWHCHLLRF